MFFQKVVSIIFFSSFVLSCFISGLAFAKNVPAAVFTQEILAYDSDGNPHPALEIKPEDLPGMEIYRFNLGKGNVLVIATNADNPFSRGLTELSETIKKSICFIEEKSGKNLETNILIYLVEMDYVPRYFKFAASYEEKDLHWDQVRLAFTKPNTQLYDPDTINGVSELIFDTLPHELGHNLLSKIPNLMHDRDGQPSKHTRWFIEGVCEVIAKDFSRQESPNIATELIKRRNLQTVLGNPRIREELFLWAQDNNHPFHLESDLYGAAYLLIKQWTKEMHLAVIINKIESLHRLIDGVELKDLLLKTTNHTLGQLYEAAKYTTLVPQSNFLEKS